MEDVQIAFGLFLIRLLRDVMLLLDFDMPEGGYDWMHEEFLEQVRIAMKEQKKEA